MTVYEKLLDRIDLNYPGLEQVKVFTEQNRNEQALDALIDYFKSRSKPVYLFDDTDLTKCTDPLIFTEAEQTMNHYIYGHQFNGPIDWNYNPTHDTSRDNEWSWSLFRNIYWQPLARAYALTRDEKYASEFASQFLSFAAAWPVDNFMNDASFEQKFKFPGHAWRTIETGMRIYTTWLPCFIAFRSSPSLTREFWAEFLSMIHDHAEFLMTHYSNHDRSSNWLSMECSAMYQCGVMFPEFKKSSSWTYTGYQRVMHEVKYCFDNDGIHMERTPIYHMVAAGAFLQAYRISVLNNIPVPPYMLSVLEKAAEFLMLLLKPDLSTPMIGDADRTDLTTARCDPSVFEGMNLTFDPFDLNELRAYFCIMADLTGREDFLYFATVRKEGSCPPSSGAAWRDAGIYVHRTGWQKNDSYVLVHGVQLERGEKSTHSHNDQGHVELMINGDDILVDCGRYIYNSSCWKNWRHYFTSACAHNTLYVDDHNMGEVPGITRVRGVRTHCHEYRSDNGYYLIDISHNGYAFHTKPIFHRRRVHFIESGICIIEDRITGPMSSAVQTERSDMRLYFNFAPGQLVRQSGLTFSYTTRSSARYTVCGISTAEASSVMLEGSEDPIGGWISYGYPVREKTPQLYFTLHDELPVRFFTVVMPESVKLVSSITGRDEKEQASFCFCGSKTCTVTLSGDTIRIQ